jgi:hypothetical protein
MVDKRLRAFYDQIFLIAEEGAEELFRRVEAKAEESRTAGRAATS